MKHSLLAAAIFGAIALSSCQGSSSSKFQDDSPAAEQSYDSIVVPDTTAATLPQPVDTPAVDTPAVVTPTVQPAPALDERPEIVAETGYVFRPGNVVPGKLIALTFDDGPSQQTPKILETLRKYNAAATFFVVGSAINPATADFMRQAVAQGSEIGSHTWEHPYMSTLDYEQTRNTIDRTNEAIANVIGVTPNFYRPPYIDVDRSVLNYAGYPAVAGLSSDDYMTSHTPEDIAQKVLSLARPNAIFVMHDLGANSRTPVALETIIPELQSRGYTLVTVTDLFTSAGVTPKPTEMYISPKTTSTPSARSTYRERRKRKAS